MSMNIGILSPRSEKHPNIGLDFFGGLKTFLKQNSLHDNVRFYTESVGFGGSEKEVYAKAEKLLMMDDVDVLIGFIDEKVLGILRPLMFSSGKLLLVVNPGANHPQNWVPQANIINLCLHHAFLCALTGVKNAGKSDSNCAMASTFYDCGYMHLAAMVRQFLQAGRNISFNYVNKDLYDENFNISALTEFLSANRQITDLLCIFDTLPAALFYSCLNKFEGAENLHLYVSPMMLEPPALEILAQGSLFSVDGYMPWHSSIENEANQEFIHTCRQLVKREANIFSLLGWESGMVLKQILSSGIEDFRDGNALAGSLNSHIIKSPRGDMKLDPETNYFVAPVVRCSYQSKSSKVEMEYNVAIESDWEYFVGEPVEGLISGWTNTYLAY